MIAAVLSVRRQAPEGGYFDDGDRASGVFGVLATGFALLLGSTAPGSGGVILGVGCVVFVSAAAWIATFPISLSI